MLSFLNNRETILREALGGILAAQPGAFIEIPNLYSYTYHKAELAEDTVKIVISGGAGYGPLFVGFVGEGLADAVSHGDFDCAPNAYALYEVAKAVHRGKGILFLTNNFTGDFLNNDMAQELLRTDGIDSMACYASDDRFSAKGEPKENRGGLCGISLLIKTAAAAAQEKLALEQVRRITQKANDRLRSVTVRLNEETGNLEFGPGFSGEAPAVTTPYTDANALVRQALGYCLEELSAFDTSSVHLQINRMAHTSYVEGYVLLHCAREHLMTQGYTVKGCNVGGYFDAFDAKGCMISVLAADEELERYLHTTPGYDFTI